MAALFTLETADGRVIAYHTQGGGHFLFTEPADGRMKGIGLSDHELRTLITELQALLV